MGGTSVVEEGSEEAGNGDAGLSLGAHPPACSSLTAMREKSPQPPAAGAPSPGDSPYGRPPVLEGRLLLEVSLFAL